MISNPCMLNRPACRRGGEAPEGAGFNAEV